MVWMGKSPCSICGRNDCGWAAGPFCEGSSPPAPEGYRIRVAMQNFGGFFFYAEQKNRKWFQNHWEQITGVLGYTPDEVLASLLRALERPAIERSSGRQS